MKCLKLVIVATALVLSTSANAAIVRTTLEGVTIGDDIYNVTFIQESYADYLVEQENYYAGIEPYSGAPSFRNYNSYNLVQPGITTSTSISSIETAATIAQFGLEAGFDFTPSGPAAATSGFILISNIYESNLGTIYGNYTSGEAIVAYETSSLYDKDANNHSSWVQLEQVSSVPVPAAVWLFGSGLLGLIGVTRRKKA